MKNWKKNLTVVAIISLLLVLGTVLVDAQSTNENNWTDQCNFEIFIHKPDNVFRADGVDTAIMVIVITLKENAQWVTSQSNVSILLNSKNGTITPMKVTIPKGMGMSEKISLTSTQPGIAKVTAKSVGGFGGANTTIKFATPPKPCELYLKTEPKQNIPANGSALLGITVKLLDKNGQPFKPRKDRIIDTWTNRGDVGPQITIYNNTLYGRELFGTYKWGPTKIEAISHHFNLTNNIEVTFSPVIIFSNIFFAFLGGILGGFLKYYHEYKKGILFWPKKQKNDTYRLGMVSHTFINGLGGTFVYMCACYDVPFTNIFGLPVGIVYGAFVIGAIGGLYGFIIIYGLGGIINFFISGQK